MGYAIQFETEALSDLKRLPIMLRKRIVNKINWLAENFDSIQPLPLAGNLAGLYKLRVGDYRVVYDFDRKFGLLRWIGLVIAGKCIDVRASYSL